MFCKQCGAPIEDGSKNCANCGAPVNDLGQQVKDAATGAFQKAEDEVKSAFDEINRSVQGQPAYAPGQKLKDDRGLIAYILLNIITCGIYGYYFLYKMAADVNVACAGDGKNTAGLVQFLVLNILTCGIYSWFWYYNLGNRLAENAPRYGLSFSENGTTVLLWAVLGAFLFGVGPFVAMYFLIKNTNAICRAYNQYNGLS
ncbi:MAG: DUF4234 domain-containing protein [Oscillospiraceae bacterium]|nr:DUF4234 domain-containing protein [Oscillospiraceae bacterium]